MHDSDESELHSISFWQKHRFIVLIGLSVVIAGVLVSVSLTLYATSGAAQLDLSRPGYKAVTSQAINKDTSFENYPTSGSLDAAALSDFKRLYDAQATKAKAVDAFSGDPLNPDALEISAPEN